MMSRNAKSLFYLIANPLMWLNGVRYRYFFSRRDLVRVHLGPGQRNYIPGWINLDANAFTGKCDVWVDLRNALPFPDSSIDAFYSHHVIEHLPDLRFHFEEMFRCLKPGGIIRIGGPNGDSAAIKFIEGDLEWFGTFPDYRRSVGGRYENFIYCRQEHLTILTFSFLEELLVDCGFSEIVKCSPVRETRFKELIDDLVLSKEWESDYDCPHTIIIEAVKPKLKIEKL